LSVRHAVGFSREKGITGISDGDHWKGLEYYRLNRQMKLMPVTGITHILRSRLLKFGNFENNLMKKELENCLDFITVRKYLSV
jgi:hypothetical protein